MEELVQTVAELLEAHFPGDNIRVEIEETIPGQKIGGSFVSSSFAGMAQIDRQKAIRDMLRGSLPLADFLSVGMILTLTPQEVSSMQGTTVAV